MNHLLKVIKFYKNLKANDFDAVKNYISDFTSITFPIKSVASNDFNILYFAKYNNTDCDYCFKQIYNHSQPFYIPIEIDNNHFFIFPAKYQIFQNHFLINDFIHREIKINKLDQMSELISIFPQMMFTSTDSLHNHFEAGIIDSPLFHLDAINIRDELYKINWFLPAFLIKDTDIKTIHYNYNSLIKEKKDQLTLLILFKRNNKFYLYIIFKNINFSNYEAMGIFILDSENSAIKQDFEQIKTKIKTSA